MVLTVSQSLVPKAEPMRFILEDKERLMNVKHHDGDCISILSESQKSDRSSASFMFGIDRKDLPQKSDNNRAKWIITGLKMGISPQES